MKYWILYINRSSAINYTFVGQISVVIQELSGQKRSMLRICEIFRRSLWFCWRLWLLGEGRMENRWEKGPSQYKRGERNIRRIIMDGCARLGILTWPISISVLGPELNWPSESTEPFKAAKPEPHEMRIVLLTTKLHKSNFVVNLLSSHLVPIYFKKSYLNTHNIVLL